MRERSEVKVWEEETVLPTYVVDDPEKLPIFHRNNISRFYHVSPTPKHQGVQRWIYPYPMSDGLSDRFEDRSYHSVYLENEYIKICIMPCLGGRIFSAFDKTNSYEIFYHHHKIKPALIGMLGAWISGGNAWGFPHHHGPNTIRSMDYNIKKNIDGSVTIWIADVDPRHRMRILVGYTIFPGRSIIEMAIRLYNKAPVVYSMLFWDNPSVHVNGTYQVIFPPSVKYATYHAKTEFITWPIADKQYGGGYRYDYKNIDVSWWKNVKRPSSFFAWQPKEDYFAGYDHGKQAGVVWVGNHHICPGMKFWAHGPNPEGDMWRDMLTDTDGHYLELMAGAYTDNQPDYSWLEPYESKVTKMVWFPIQNLEGLKYANLKGALNLEIDSPNLIKIRINTTSKYSNARVVLIIKGKTTFEEVIDIDPSRPYSKNIPLTENIIEQDISLSLYSSEGELLLHYKPIRQARETEPEPYSPPPNPKDIKTLEELYLTGLRLEQFYNSEIDTYQYFEEALKRDPYNSQVNTYLGILYCKRWLWKEAEEKLNIAIKRITYNYTRPKDAEAFYYLGIALKAQGRIDEAYDIFYKATWCQAWHAPAYYALAEIDCQRHDFVKALEHLDRSISTNTNNLKALNLKTIVLRRLGQYEAAEQKAAMVTIMDPLDHQSRNELVIIKSLIGLREEANQFLNELDKIMRDDINSYLELALSYSNAGFYDEAIEILLRLEKIGIQYPMVYYYLGYYWGKKGDESKSLNYYAIANKLPYDYCFPFYAEDIEILKHASIAFPKDARPYYYLGNLLYEYQPENAIVEWEKARDYDGTFYVVHRNLGLAYEEVEKNIRKAIASMERAINCNNKEARLYYELDMLYEKGKVPPKKRLQILEKNHEIIAKRDDVLSRKAHICILLGKYDCAIEIMTQNHFNRWEGSSIARFLYEDAHILRGLQYFKNGKYLEALKDFEASLQYPRNLDIGKPPEYERFSQIFYLMGRVYCTLGKKDEAQGYFKKAVKNNAEQTEYAYYQGLAYQELGNPRKAQKVFDGLLKFAQKRISAEPFLFESQNIRIADKHFLIGLAYLGKKMNKEAKIEFNKVLEFHPDHVWAREHLKML